MTVRLKERPKKKPRPSAPPRELTRAEQEVEALFIPKRANVQIWEHVRRLLIGKNEEEIAVILMNDHGLSMGAAKKFVHRVRARTQALASQYTKTGKADLIVELRTRVTEMTLMIHNERVREEQARREKTTYKRRSNCPTEGDIRATAELIAKIEGHFAPTKTVNVSTFVGQEVLELLGVQSAQEVAELIGEGREIIDTEGENADG